MIIALILLCVTLVIIRELCFKYGVNTKGARFFIGVGLMLGITEIILWARVLQLAPLSVAFPFMSLGYIALPLAGYFFLKETIVPLAWTGIFLITIGVICVGLTGLG